MRWWWSWLAFVGAAVPCAAHAGDTTVLPRGNGQLQIDTQIYFQNPPEMRLGPRRDANAPLAVSYDVRATVLVPSLAFGLAKQLTVAVYVPIYAQASVTISEFQLGGVPGTAATQNALRQMGFKDAPGGAPVSDWQASGVGDLWAGARWRVVESGGWSAAATVALSLPTGRTDDPDLLTDFGFGSGDVALQGWFSIDREFAGHGLVDLTASYKAQLPDQPIVHPVFGTREQVHRDLGDIVSVEAELRYALGGWVPLSLVYRFADKTQDQYQGNQPLFSLEENTAGTTHTIGGGIGLSSVEAFQGHRFVYPFVLRAAVFRTFSSSSSFENTTAEALLNLYF
jgi:hypothetical protein